MRKNTSNEQNVHEFYMLNHGIRHLLFHYKKRCYFASILFGKSVLKKMHHLSSRACENNVNSTKSQPKILFDWINKTTSDKR